MGRSEAWDITLRRTEIPGDMCMTECALPDLKPGCWGWEEEHKEAPVACPPLICESVTVLITLLSGGLHVILVRSQIIPVGIAAASKMRQGGRFGRVHLRIEDRPRSPNASHSPFRLSSSVTRRSTSHQPQIQQGDGLLPAGTTRIRSQWQAALQSRHLG